MHPEILATKLLLRQEINGIPTNILKLNCNGAVIVDSVQHYARVVQCSPDDFLGPGARDCSVMYRRGKHIILYNDCVLSTARKRWSIAHEIGHICCGHTSDGLKEEQEANAFAGELLIPSVVLHYLLNKKYISTVNDVADIFKVSLQAAQIRLDTLSQHCYTSLDKNLLELYIPIIQKKCTEPIITIPRKCFYTGVTIL